MKKIFKYISYNIIIVLILVILIETIFFSARLLLKRDSVGFLFSLKSEQNKYLLDDCLRMKTHILLSHSHDTKKNCNILNHENYDDQFIWYKNNEKNKKKITILTLGGSTTDGFYYHISNFRTWPYILNELCNEKYDCTIINGGVGGYNTSQELLKYLIYSNQLGKLDFVISLNGINEINTTRDINNKLKKKFPFQTKVQYTMTSKEKWLKQNKLQINFLPNFMSFFKFKKNYDFNVGITEVFDKKKMFDHMNKVKIKNLDYNVDIWRNNISNMNSLVRNNGGIFLSILQPTMGLDYVKVNWKKKGNDFEMYNNFYQNPLRSEVNYFYKKSRKICNNLNYCFDLSETASPGNDDIFFNPRHHNEKGNYIIGNEIFKIIEKNL